MISTQPLTEFEREALLTGANSQHLSSIDIQSLPTEDQFCSNVKSVNRSDSIRTRLSFNNDLSNHQSIYSFLDHATCMWTFSKWYTLSQLNEDCGVDLPARHITLIVYTWYVQFSAEQELQFLYEAAATAFLLPNSSPSPLLSSPVHFLARNNGTDTDREEPYIFPITVQRTTGIYFYSVVKFDSDILCGTYSSPFMSENQSLILLNNDSDQKRQAWLLEIDGDYSVFKYDIVLQACGEHGNTEPIQFRLELQKTLNFDISYVPVLDIVASVQLQQNGITSVNEERENVTSVLPVFTIGEKTVLFSQECLTCCIVNRSMLL